MKTMITTYFNTRKTLFITAIMAISLITVRCSSYGGPNEQTGSIIGGVLGSVAGKQVGKGDGRTALLL